MFVNVGLGVFRALLLFLRELAPLRLETGVRAPLRGVAEGEVVVCVKAR